MSTESLAQQWNRSRSSARKVVLAVDPTVKGIGYVVFQRVNEPLDWGTTDLRFSKNARSMSRVKRLCKIYKPSTIVLEDTDGTESYRCERVEKLIKHIMSFAKEAQIQCISYAPEQVKEVFENFGASTKHTRAQKISTWLPELGYLLPQKRAVYEPEHMHYGVFDAAALALTHYYLLE